MSTEQTRKVLKIDCGSRRCVHSANHRRPCPDCSCEKVRSLTFESIPSLRCSLFAAFPHQFRSLHSDPCSGPGGTHGRTMICMELVLAVRRPGSRRACDADGARQVLRPLCVLVPAEGQASIASFSSHSVASSSASGCSLLFVSPPHRLSMPVLSSLHAPHVQTSHHPTSCAGARHPRQLRAPRHTDGRELQPGIQ